MGGKQKNLHLPVAALTPEELEIRRAGGAERKQCAAPTNTHMHGIYMPHSGR